MDRGPCFIYVCLIRLSNHEKTHERFAARRRGKNFHFCFVKKWYLWLPLAGCALVGKQVSWWNIRCVKIALSTFHHIYIHQNGRKIFYRAKWRTRFGKKGSIITAKGQKLAYSSSATIAYSCFTSWLNGYFPTLNEIKDILVTVTRSFLAGRICMNYRMFLEK